MLQAKYSALAPELTERSRRLWAATEATALGHGGIALVERATGISRSTIQRGIRVRSEIDQREYPAGVSVTDEQMHKITIRRHRFHGDWNYTIQPST